EAHGTGTSLGDPIEMEALRSVYGAPRAGGAPCYVASLKTNVGHMEAAAGIGGLLKLVLALEHELMPAHLHLEMQNPRLSLGGSALAPPTERRPWPRGERPGRAAVSSFGISGTNAHVIVEEAPLPRGAAAPDGAAVLLPISARGPDALRALLGRYRALLSDP